ncbi:hypothetical protein MRX96_020912 [Rhipicephalus microplus]
MRVHTHTRGALNGVVKVEPSQDKPCSTPAPFTWFKPWMFTCWITLVCPDSSKPGDGLPVRGVEEEQGAWGVFPGQSVFDPSVKSVPAYLESLHGIYPVERVSSVWPDSPKSSGRLGKVRGTLCRRRQACRTWVIVSSATSTQAARRDEVEEFMVSLLSRQRTLILEQ